jgi:hypothetical protein
MPVKKLLVLFKRWLQRRRLRKQIEHLERLRRLAGSIL